MELVNFVLNLDKISSNYRLYIAFEVWVCFDWIYTEML